MENVADTIKLQGISGKKEEPNNEVEKAIQNICNGDCEKCKFTKECMEHLQEVTGW